MTKAGKAFEKSRAIVFATVCALLWDSFEVAVADADEVTLYFGLVVVEAVPLFDAAAEKLDLLLYNNLIKLLFNYYTIESVN